MKIGISHSKLKSWSRLASRVFVLIALFAFVGTELVESFRNDLAYEYCDQSDQQDKEGEKEKEEKKEENEKDEYLQNLLYFSYFQKQFLHKREDMEMTWSHPFHETPTPPPERNS